MYNKKQFRHVRLCEKGWENVRMKKKASPAAVKYNILMEKHFFFRLLDRVKYELPVLAVLLIIYAFQHNFGTGDVYNILHIYDYRIGFAPRLFIGSLMSLFTDYKSLAFMNRFFNVFCVASIFLFSFAAGRVIRKSDDTARNTAMIFVLLFLAVPYSRTVFYPHLVSLDRFLVVLTLLTLLAISKKGFRWLVPLMIIMSLATYQGYAFTYMPAVAILLIYEVYRNKNSKQSIALCVAGFAAMAALSAYFFLYRGINSFDSIEELITYSLDKTDIRDHVGEFDMRWVLQLLVMTPGEFWGLNLQTGALENLSSEVAGMLYLSPLLVIFFLIWLDSVKKSKNKFEKFLYILCMTAPLMRLPMLVLSQNYFRSRVSLVIVQFFLVFYFLYVGDPVVCAALRKTGEFLKKNYFILAALIVYFLFFVKMH
jgi:hypothetical protein